VVKQPTFLSNTIASGGHCGKGAIRGFNSTFNVLKRRRSKEQEGKGRLMPKKKSKQREWQRESSKKGAWLEGQTKNMGCECKQRHVDV
jgi:hypothetical protein